MVTEAETIISALLPRIPALLWFLFFPSSCCSTPLVLKTILMSMFIQNRSLSLFWLKSVSGGAEGGGCGGINIRGFER